MREVIAERRLRPHELRELITALGENRSDAAIEILYELASDGQTFEQCEDNIINAIAALDTPRGRELLLGFVDPDIRAIPLTRRPRREDILVTRLTELAQHDPEVAARLRNLCERKLPEFNRHVLSRVMGGLGTAEAMLANLNLVDDTEPSSIPQGLSDQLERAFVKREPYGQNHNAFTVHARVSNDLRARLLRMALEDG